MITYDVDNGPPPHVTLWDSCGNRWDPAGVAASIYGDAPLWSTRPWFGMTSWYWVDMQRFAPFTDEPWEPK